MSSSTWFLTRRITTIPRATRKTASVRLPHRFPRQSLALPALFRAATLPLSAGPEALSVATKVLRMKRRSTAGLVIATDLTVATTTNFLVTAQYISSIKIDEILYESR
jgi:hypothetical protein